MSSPKPKIVSARQLSRLGSAAVLSDFCAHFSTLNYSECDDLNVAASTFCDRFISLVDRHAPVRQIVVNSLKFAPWCTASIRLAQREVRTHYRRSRRSPNDIKLFNRFREARASYQLKLSTARTDYYSSRLHGLAGAALWRELNHLALTSSSPAMPRVPADELNAYFASISTTMCTAELQTSTLSPATSAAGSVQAAQTFDFSPVNEDEVSEIIQSIKSSAVGADGLSGRMIRLTLSAVLPVLTWLFNLSFTTDTFPSVWKRALIVPVNKVKCPSVPADYRPIALLPFLSKVLERLAYNQLSTYLLQHSLLDPRQCGFRPGHSTQTALLRLVNDIRCGMDVRKVTVLVLFDFSKAFDTVFHPLLLAKLLKLGLSPSAISWFESYLSNRSQAVKCSDGSLSSWRSTNTGVPQGSILGPLLFSIFINDISSCIRESSYLLYADDLQIYLSCHPADLNNCLLRLNNDILRIRDWAISNQLNLNLGKTKSIIFGARRFINNIHYDELRTLGYDGLCIPFTNCVRNLGVFMDSKLTFADHVHHVSKRVNSAYHQLFCLRRYTDQQLRRTLVNALILPHILYCLLVTQGAGTVLDLKLQRLINKGARYVLGLPRDASISQACRSLGWLTINEYRQQFLGSIVYRALRTHQPDYLAELLVAHSAGRTRRLVSAAQLLLIPNYRTDAYKEAFAVAAPSFWNQLPDPIRLATSFATFKSSLRAWTVSLAIAGD